MNIVYGDAIQALKNKEIEVLVHGCNCFCTMGKGVAKIIKEKYPEVYKADCNTNYGDFNKLGTIDTVYCIDGSIIINAYTQYKYCSHKPMLDYDALRLCLRKINQNYILKTRKIGLPKIGCGLAGGEWDLVKLIIEEELPNCTIYVYN